MADRHETAAPWGSLPGDKDDPNYGRVCGRCGGAIRAGLRHAYVCPQHPETASMRLAEAATEGPYGVHLHHVFVVGPDGKRARGMQVGMWPAIATACRAEDAEWIAHAHPGRVRAWLGAVARLRERAERGHASDCVRRLGDDATVYRSSDDGDTHHRVRVGDLPCTCGHDLDLAALAAVDAEG